MKKRAGFSSAIAVALVAMGVVGCEVQQQNKDAAVAGADVPVFEDLGTYSRAISTDVEPAQRYFDQGLRLTVAFNHAEAIRAFQHAAKLDSACAMCYWGIAYAYGPNINAPMDSASGVAAYNAVQRAKALSAQSTPVERALIDALTKRYAQVPPADRAALDQAYASAMHDVKQQFPDDVDVATFWAEAAMDLSPWDYWTADGKPRAHTAEAVSELERVLAAKPDHPGACHYYIHAVEAAQPQKAVACAERLASLMPGAGHLVHMPAHIYIRVGRWNDAITANQHAVHTDETYIKDQGPSGVYPIAYYPHNYHFLSFAATMAGRTQEAIGAARGVAKAVPVDVARQVPPVEGLVPYVHLTLVTFGRWDEVLAEPVPPSDLRFATALTQYARGVAHAAKGDAAQARAALDTVRAIVAATKDPLGHTVLDIANHALAGEVAARTGDARGGETHFRQALALEDGLLYMEPPHWYYPIRHSLGALLLSQGRAREAEPVFRKDLERFPENTWGLNGLEASLRAQGKTAEADAIDARIAKLGGDVQLSSSRL
jgi:tetratricopeptide (TPR) repeat protein